jgi:hypothetical protein
MIVLAGFVTLLAGLGTYLIFAVNDGRSPLTGRSLLWFLWLLAALCWGVAVAQAHDHDNPGMNDWLKSLHSSGGAWCCNGDDTDPIDDWERRGDRYRVKFRGEWYDVPDSAVIAAPNRGGGALLWMNKGYSGMAVRCFLPGTLS